MILISFIIKIFEKRHSKSLKHCGLNVRIPYNTRISGPSNITIGDNTYIGSGCWLAAQALTNENNCNLSIGKKCSIGRFAHIFATSSIILEDSVLLAEKVYISDNQHAYEDIAIPIKDQPIIQKKTVTIGEGSWLGENVCVIGASVGKHCVIGANSVVTHDIPDYCVAVGSPAKVIKKYDFELKKWININ